MLITVFRLYVLHISAFIAVWFSTYFPGLDIFLSLLFLVVIGFESRFNQVLIPGQRFLAGIIWQCPAIALSIIIISGIPVGGLGNYAVFILQFWLTPLLPLLSLLPGTLFWGKPAYYYALLGLPLIIVFYYYLSWAYNQKSVGGFKINNRINRY